MRLGEVANEEARKYGKPLDGVRVLALEQMQALPYATQLLARLGAEVVKIEAPSGESGRGAQPGMLDPQGRFVGATFLRNNLSKRSVTVNLKSDKGRELVLALAPKFDVFAENFKAGALERMGLGYDAVAAVHPSVIYASVSGFGNSGSPYADWPAYASIAEAMSGIYDYVLVGDEIPRPNPVGALGDISSALFAAIGILAALRHRDATGEGQQVDIAMFDATVAMTDIVTNLGSLGMHRLNEPKNVVLDPFRASDGWFVLQLVREHQLERIANLVGHPEWPTDPRLATRIGWAEHVDDMLRPAIEAWAGGLTKLEAAQQLSAAGIAAAPLQTTEEVMADPHLAARHMLVEMQRTDGGEHPVVIPGNPVKLSKVAEGPESRVPWVGE
ncbi:MAG TPA: CoA transferase, partial [Acidimicrobiales bacterium]|nr:CoA transferase [Acidimicrobiales bacterium]